VFKIVAQVSIVMSDQIVTNTHLWNSVQLFLKQTTKLAERVSFNDSMY